MHDVRAYYQDEAVRARMLDFLGGTAVDDVPAVYIRALDGVEDELQAPARPPEQLWSCLEEGCDVARSFWDRQSLLVDLDVEYVNFDFPAEAYLDPVRAFAIQEPVEHAIQQILLRFGIAPLHLISGRGHHFLWRISRESIAFHRLAEITVLPPFLHGFYHSAQAPNGEVVPETCMAAFTALGMVMEYLAHLVKEESVRICTVPVELTAVRVGCRGVGREMVSLDISEYGDPLTMRCLRIPFSIYSKTTRLFTPDNGHPLHASAPLFLVPRHESDIRETLLTMRSPELAQRLARRASTAIPAQEAGTSRLIDAYERSELAAFHRFFYEKNHDPPDRWSESYDRAAQAPIPPCTRAILENPNDALLKPEGLELVVKTFLALGWHPRHIAGMIRSRYERDFGWGDRWYRENAGTRADFYTRIFAGLVAVGLDELIGFNCRSMQEKDCCLAPDPACNLEAYRQSLLERVRHERLASGPINRLLLSDQHL